jgi:purine-nucleoside phosphorylase
MMSHQAAAAAIRPRMMGRQPEVAITLGSGLGGLADRITDAIRIPYGEIPGFHVPSVEGHKGELVVGTLGGKTVLAQSGRFHMYEGYSASESVLPVRTFGELGVTTLIVTNAAGGVNRAFGPGTIMLITDHINLSGRTPLEGPVLPGELRFPDMTTPYDAELRGMARQVADAEEIAMAEGVYLALLGPSYETSAEVRMLGVMGADAVGMSTAVEVIAARARGMRCLGFSTVTNAATGTSAELLSHAEVMEVAGQAGNRVGTIIEGVIAAMPLRG